MCVFVCVCVFLSISGQSACLSLQLSDHDILFELFLNLVFYNLGILNNYIVSSRQDEPQTRPMEGHLKC